MLSLLKADLYRILKSKLTIVALIVMFVLPILMAGLYWLIDAFLQFEMEAAQDVDSELVMVGSLMSGKALLGSVYSLTQNGGLLVIIFSTIFVSMDLSSGTLRNKVIVGHSRAKVFMSHFLASSIFNVVMMTINALMTLLCAFVILDYGTDFNAEEAKFLVQWILAGTLTFIWIASITNFLMLVMKNVALSIIFTIVIGMIISLAASLTSGFYEKSWGFVIYFIPTMITTLISSPGFEITWLPFAYNTISCLALIALNCFLGILLFKKHDIK